MTDDIYPFVADTIVTLRVIEEGYSESYMQDFRDETKILLMAEMMCRGSIITNHLMEMSR